MKNKKKTQKQRRKRRIRSKIFGTEKRPRLCVYRSNRYIYAQVIDDKNHKTLFGVSEKKAVDKKDSKLKKVERARLVGETLAERLEKKKITKIVFDRNGYRFHGRVKALAKGIKEKGLKF